MVCLIRIRQLKLSVTRAETTSTWLRTYSLGSTPARKEELFLLRIATTITLQMLMPLRPVKVAKMTAEKEARIRAEKKPIKTPELAITAAK